jgi:tetratricopeptide (TPR) repeat protein
MIRSRLAISAAVSAKSPISAMKSINGKSAGAAGPSFCKLKKCRPGNNNLGIALKEQGQFDEAQRASERALQLAPRNGLYYRQLFNGMRVVAGDRGLAAAEKLAEDMASLPVGDQKELHFALGKAYADMEQRERSFRHFLEGNALKRREFVYDEPGMLGFLDRVRTVFTAELMHSKRDLGNPSMVPIFIVGMPRSGTTLVEQILASHPEVFGAGELTEFSKAVTSLGMPNGALSYPEAVPALSAEQLRQLGASYLDAVVAAAPVAERITDKMPGNFSFVGLIHLALPNARIIHMRRDPIDTCLSCFSLLFTGDLPYGYDLGELGRFYRAYQTLMEHWRQVLPAGVMLEIRYEEWLPISSGRHVRSSPIVVSNGTMRVLLSIRRNVRFRRRAQPRSVSPSTALRLADGSVTSTSCSL